VSTDTRLKSARCWPALDACAIVLTGSTKHVPFINFPAREINCKLVYYGQVWAERPPTLQWIYDHPGKTKRVKWSPWLRKPTAPCL